MEYFVGIDLGSRTSKLAVIIDGEHKLSLHKTSGVNPKITGTELLDDAMGKLGISQDKLSKLAGITLHTITKIECGATPDPRIETVKKIADALGVSVDELLKS